MSLIPRLNHAITAKRPASALSRCIFAKESAHRQMYPFTEWHFVIYCVHGLKNHEKGISYPSLVKKKLMNHHRPIYIGTSKFVLCNRITFRWQLILQLRVIRLLARLDNENKTTQKAVELMNS